MSCAYTTYHQPSYVSDAGLATDWDDAPQLVTVDYATTDQRRIYRETFPVPIPTTSSSNDDSGSAPSVDDPPLSIPNWAPFFRDDGMDDAEDNTAEPSAQEHARRYVNSVSG